MSAVVYHLNSVWGGAEKAATATMLYRVKIVDRMLKGLHGSELFGIASHVIKEI
jgi:hypothetical protein